MIKGKIFLVAAFLAAFIICAFQSGVAEAAADIKYEVTNIQLLPSGRCVINGVFYNKGDAAAIVTSIRFLGCVRASKDGTVLYNIDTTFSKIKIEINCPPNDRRLYSFTFSDKKNIIPYDRGRSWEGNYYITWE